MLAASEEDRTVYEALERFQENEDVLDQLPDLAGRLEDALGGKYGDCSG